MVMWILTDIQKGLYALFCHNGIMRCVPDEAGVLPITGSPAGAGENVTRKKIRPCVAWSERDAVKLVKLHVVDFGQIERINFAQ